MELLESQLAVKKSTLPNAGKGLFTKKAIAKESLIVEYKGRITTWKEVAVTDVNNPYIFFVNRNHVIDAKDFKDGVAQYANDAKGLTKIKGITNNAAYILKGKKAFIKATKDIPAGAEILVGYGKEYWDVIKHNIKIEQQITKKDKAAKKK